MNEDLDLSYHYDNAEVTLNVSLGKDFTEGNLYFGDMRQVILYYNALLLLLHKMTTSGVTVMFVLPPSGAAERDGVFGG